MFNHFSSKLFCVQRVCPSLFESRVTICNAEGIFNTYFDCICISNICEFHLFTIPLKFFIKTLKFDSKNSHYNHFIEWSCF